MYRAWAYNTTGKKYKLRVATTFRLQIVDNRQLTKDE